MPRRRHLNVAMAGALLMLATMASVTNTPQAQGGTTPEEIFQDLISGPIVQSRCVNCHVAGGLSGHTRLVLVRSTETDHEALNLEAFRALLDAVTEEGGVTYVLNKIQGVSHGGGPQVPAGSADFASMELFLRQLGGASGTVTAALTPETLFDTVRLAPDWKTLRRAALIFAGRIPTDTEYAAVANGSESDLRAAIRGLMQGPQFHEFLIRGSNDRLLTDRETGGFIDDGAFFVDHVNEHYRRKRVAHEIDSERAWEDFHHWLRVVSFGARRAPLELIAYVVENDRPYTEILTADYVMANPWAARAYGASTYFRDPEDEHEFRPSRIVKYYRMGEGYEVEEFPELMASRVIDPGPLRTVYPHAGILNTLSFLQRYPTTATNRNRARARWTYYHFLGLDIEKSAGRTTDPIALADTHNPTMRNPACTVCHSVMDPVAGAFQNYDEEGRYKSQWGGVDSLDDLYKYDDEGPTSILRAGTWRTREALSWQVPMSAGTQTLRVLFANPFHDDDTGEQRFVYLDRMSVLDDEGEEIVSHEFEDLGPPTHPDGWECGEVLENPSTGRRDHLFLHWGHHGCAIFVDFESPRGGIYEVRIVAWAEPNWYERFGDDGFAKLSVVVNAYEEGDVWYGDMRAPGFHGATAPDSDSSLQWLAQQIVADERFAEAAVKFWWPAIMGSEVARFPEDERDTDFAGLLLAANAQNLEVTRLAGGFRSGFPGSPFTYNLKDLLTGIVLSKWFRADTVTAVDPVRRVALQDAGARRLLTPEELARKTEAVTGFEWGRHIRTGCYPECDRTPNALTSEYRMLYGGIDSDGIPKRARDFTSVMAGVAARHAVESSCPIVMRELYLLPDRQRRLFAGIDPYVTPTSEFSDVFEVRAASRSGMQTFGVQGHLSAGNITVYLAFLNDFWDEVLGDRNVLLDRLTVRQGSKVVYRYEMENLDHQPECHHMEQGAFHLSGSDRGCVLSVPVEMPEDGVYRIEISAWGTQAGDELPKLSLTVESGTGTSAGSSAIRDKLVELHDKLLGVRAAPDSPDVEDAYRLFVDVWQRKRHSEETGDYFRWLPCHWHRDLFFYEGILGDALTEREDEWGRWRDFDDDRINDFLDGIEFSDLHYTAQTWVVVLTAMLMDYRYLYL